MARAKELAGAAVSETAKQLRAIDFVTVRTSDIANVVSLEHYLDTVGWIEFQQGDFAAAEKHLSAAWSLGDDAVVGDHLAQTYERENRKSDAIRLYELTLACPRPPQEARARLASRLGNEADVDATVIAARSALSQRRTSKLSQAYICRYCGLLASVFLGLPR